MVLFLSIVPKLRLCDHEGGQHGKHNLQGGRYGIRIKLVVDRLCQSEESTDRDEVAEGEADHLGL